MTLLLHGTIDACHEEISHLKAYLASNQVSSSHAFRNPKQKNKSVGQHQKDVSYHKDFIDHNQRKSQGRVTYFDQDMFQVCVRVTLIVIVDDSLK